jgi:hypothetical protein
MRRDIKRAGRAFAVLAVAVVAVMAVTGAAAGSRSGATPANRVVANRVFAKMTLVQLRGKRVAGACRYAGSVVLPRGQKAVQLDEVAENAGTCTMTLTRTMRPMLAKDKIHSSSLRVMTGSRRANSSSKRPGSCLPPSSPTRLTSHRSRPSARRLLGPNCGGNPGTHSAGYAKGWWEDVVGIDLTKVTDSIDWWWDGTYVSSVTCSYSYSWDSTTGWGLRDNNFYCQYNSGSTQGDSSSYVHFQNDLFCWPISTSTYYNREHAYGKYNGALLGSFNTSKNGDCSGTMSFHYAVVRTLN